MLSRRRSDTVRAGRRRSPERVAARLLQLFELL